MNGLNCSNGGSTKSEKAYCCKTKQEMGQWEDKKEEEEASGKI